LLTKGANRPEIAMFFQAIDTLVSSERGARYDDAEDGPRLARTVAYGSAPAQVGELYLPYGASPFPIVVLIHGGYWTAMFDRRQMTRAGRRPRRAELRGLEHRVPAHRRSRRRLEGHIYGHGGGAVPTLSPMLDLTRVAVGHSAGGHLAAWAATRSVLPAEAPGAHPGVELSAAVSAGVLDLVAADAVDFAAVLADPDAPPPVGAPEPARPELGPVVAAQVGDGVVVAARRPGGGRARTLFVRIARPAAPGRRAGVGCARHCGRSSSDCHARAYERAAQALHTRVELVEVPDSDHFDVIDPSRPSWAIVCDWPVKSFA
jgi:acetyl esterase/lipase